MVSLFYQGLAIVDKVFGNLTAKDAKVLRIGRKKMKKNQLFPLRVPSYSYKKLRGSSMLQKTFFTIFFIFFYNFAM
mgnify:CR=1 FL=1